MRSGIFTGWSLWNFALYVQDEPFSHEMKLIRPRQVFNSRRIKFGAHYPRDQADPFLILDEGHLYVLYEKRLHRGLGEIACVRTRDLETFEDLGTILREPHHLSYPFVFRHQSDIFLVPEARDSGEVPLYRFGHFPFGLQKVRSLLNGSYADSFVIKWGSLWYLFASSKSGLEIYFTKDILRGGLTPHPLNPVVTDPRFARNGGGPLTIGGSLVRVAQDCSRSYGRNVMLLQIDELSPEAYSESIIRADFFDRNKDWNKFGAHHLSVTHFLGKTVIAADGASRDFLVNKLIDRLRVT